MKRKLAAAAAATLLATTACGGNSAGKDEESLTYWSMWEENEPQAQVLKSAFAGFAKATGIKVNAQWQGREVQQKLVPVLRSGDVPDLVDQDGNKSWAPFADAGQARDLSAVYAAQVPGEGRTVSEVGARKYQDLVKGKNGKPYMVPYEVIAVGLFYDGATHTEPPPATWDDFVAQLDKLKAAGRQPLAVDGDIGGYTAMWLVELITREMGDGTLLRMAQDKTGASWHDPKVLSALKKAESLAKGGYFLDGSFGSKFPAMQEKWASGASDFLLMGTWVSSETKKSVKPGFVYRSFPFPGISGTRSVRTSLIGFGIPERAAHAEAAEKFIAYFMKKDVLSGIATTALNITPRPDIPAPEPVADLAEALADAPTVPYFDGADVLPNYPVEVFTPLATELLSGKASAEEFVQKIKDAQVQYWKKQG
ncbi:raffinose/stachyose/melibiose transport system substrate-binding protein [Nonomuraea thailandensis]|uniref:Raffinose/stachyose/melibiose transport system substrate-binding protein n=1 Tax=Nonomuraea thailandensis TaxID=1188745 RepID=A0A9X2G985_9ACTN|nr:ABC transporter substrate-binding protein [Nonomuraea thailandensis]MCP2353595.1 raffinose/stachyose/melibiose transport system substrate-binding protein [Nonomuraea thailandensis]